MTETEIMLRAIELAKKAAELDEVPVGAVVVKDGEIVGEGFNRRETGKNALAHAELEAIDSACKRLGGWRLHQCEIYVTLEPCPMCTGAIINSRVAYNALARHHFYAFFCGYSTQYDGNVDYESHTVHQEKKGRYALVEMPQKEPSFISAIIDVSGFVKEPSQKEEFSMDGMSGGGLFTCTNNNSSLFLGMCLAGTVESKRAHFLSVCYIEFMLSEYLKGENVVVSSTVPNT